LRKILLRDGKTTAKRAALKDASSRLQQVLAVEGISDEETLAEFKSWRRRSGTPANGRVLLHFR
jgi:hypothetical protein